MRNPYQAARQPSQNEVQSLLNLLNAGQLPQAETTAKSLLRVYPGALIFHNVLGVALEGQGKFQEAVASYRAALVIDPKIAEIHFNLGVVLANLGRLEEAVASYRKAVNLKPNLAVACFNLAIALQELGRLDEAIPNYRKTVALEPGFYEAHGNLGTVLQKQGKLEEAVTCYRKAIAIHPDAKGHFNLATALRDQGKLEEAVSTYRKAIALKPDYPEAWNNLGEALRDQGKMDEAVASYHQALATDPENPAANYNVAEFLYLAGKYAEAIPYFEKSRLWDAWERTLYCLYKSARYDEFEEKLEPLLAEKNTSPLLATLSIHHATNFGVEDRYNFCKSPMDFVFHSRIEQLAEENSPLLEDLLRDISFTEIAERKQGRLYYGIQSAGNLLKRPEASFKALAALIREKIEAYRRHFSGADCELIKSFPAETEFSSSWYLKMQQGGHLTSHIHEEGWISGCVYLALPQKNGGHDGSIEFSTHGDDYPQKHDNFPARVIDQRVGDIVLFPSSLFHRTIPFNSREDRVCVAFDLKPAALPRSLPGFKMLLLGWLSVVYSEVAELLLVPLYYFA